MIILATNFAQNFDPAFMCRITLSIRFELPDVNLRKELWKDMLQATPFAQDTVTIEIRVFVVKTRRIPKNILVL